MPAATPYALGGTDEAGIDGRHLGRHGLQRNFVCKLQELLAGPLVMGTAWRGRCAGVLPTAGRLLLD
jgi:hypothetical protein